MRKVWITIGAILVSGAIIFNTFQIQKKKVVQVEVKVEEPEKLEEVEEVEEPSYKDRGYNILGTSDKEFDYVTTKEATLIEGGPIDCYLLFVDNDFEFKDFAYDYAKSRIGNSDDLHFIVNTVTWKMARISKTERDIVDLYIGLYFKGVENYPEELPLLSFAESYTIYPTREYDGGLTGQ